MASASAAKPSILTMENNVGVTFSGTNACSYGFPSVTTTGGAVATVTENKAPLTVTVPDYTTVYGAATFNYASQMKITGAVGNDLNKLSATFTNGPPPPTTAMDSSVLNVDHNQPGHHQAGRFGYGDSGGRGNHRHAAGRRGH